MPGFKNLAGNPSQKRFILKNSDHVIGLFQAIPHALCGGGAGSMVMLVRTGGQGPSDPPEPIPPRSGIQVTI